MSKDEVMNDELVNSTASGISPLTTHLYPTAFPNTGKSWNSVFGSTSPLIDPAVLEQRIERLEVNMTHITHINVAKDQENRICELESVVTELMEYIKEKKLQEISEKEKMTRIEKEYHDLSLRFGSAGLGSSGTSQVQYGNHFAIGGGGGLMGAQVPMTTPPVYHPLGALAQQNMASQQNAYQQLSQIQGEDLTLMGKAKKAFGIK